jgi:hypothetical protein
MKRNWSSILLWYLALLAVMLPHTAWAFGKHESLSAIKIGGIAVLAWFAAFAFEAAIAALTHKLAKRIEKTPRYSAGHIWWRRLSYQYINAYAFGLFTALAVSALANFAHAVEFSSSFAVFDVYSIPPVVYHVAFGGILPLVSLLFARILADDSKSEQVAPVKRPVSTKRPAKARTVSTKQVETASTVQGQSRNGSKTKTEHIKEIYKANPEISKAEIVEETGASRTLVYDVISTMDGDS